MNIQFVHLPEFDDPIVGCELCLSNTGPHYEASLLGGYICSICMEETLDSFNNYTRVHTMPFVLRPERKAINQLMRKTEYKLLFDKT